MNKIDAFCSLIYVSPECCGAHVFQCCLFFINSEILILSLVLEPHEVKKKRGNKDINFLFSLLSSSKAIKKKTLLSTLKQQCSWNKNRRSDAAGFPNSAECLKNRGSTLTVMKHILDMSPTGCDFECLCLKCINVKIKVYFSRFSSAYDFCPLAAHYVKKKKKNRKTNSRSTLRRMLCFIWWMAFCEKPYVLLLVDDSHGQWGTQENRKKVFCYHCFKKVTFTSFLPCGWMSFCTQ